MSYGLLFLKKQTKCRSGLRSAVKHDKLAAVAVGDRSKKTCQELWDAIPEEYQRGHSSLQPTESYQLQVIHYPTFITNNPCGIANGQKSQNGR